MSNIKSIGLVFENGDYVFDINTKYIGEFRVINKKTDIVRTDMMDISEVCTCDTFVLELFKEVNDDKHLDTNMGDYKITDRIIDREDMVAVYLDYDDGDKYEETVYVPWEEGCGDSGKNICQVNYRSKDGNVYTVLTNGPHFDSFFDKPSIEHLDFNKGEGYGCVF